MGVLEDYKAANLINEKEKFTMLALLGFVGLGGLHRFIIGAKTSDEQQYFLGAIYLLPAVLVGLLYFFGNGEFKLWYLAPLILTVLLTIHDLTSMNRLLKGELSAKKAWYETWPGRVGAVLLFPIALYFLYKKTDLPQQQKNAIAGTLGAGLLLFLGASFTGVEQLTSDEITQSNASDHGLYETCDQAREAGEELPIMADSDKYAAWLDRDQDGLACE